MKHESNYMGVILLFGFTAALVLLLSLPGGAATVKQLEDGSWEVRCEEALP